MNRRRWALLAFFLPLFGAQSPDSQSAQRKFDLIESEKLRPGSRVILSSRELNAYVATEAAQYAPQAVRNPQLQLGEGSATGTALIDFLKLRQAEGKSPGWVMSKLLAGERPVRVMVRIQSGSGSARVDVERVEVAGVAIEGKTLDFLIENFLIPQFPDAQVARPFKLGHRMDHLEVKPDAVTVVIGR